MSEPFIGEIRLVAFNYAPRNWAFCDGQTLPIRQNEALFALLGTTYGGDGTNTFALPDLRGRASLHSGQGPGLILRQLGEVVGQEAVRLDIAEMPAHTHTAVTSAPQASIAVTNDFVSTTVKVPVTKEGGGTDDPTNAILATATIPKGEAKVYSTGDPNGSLKEFAADVTVDPSFIGVSVGKPGVALLDTGGSQPHNNMQPSLVLNYIIALEGIFPPRG